MRAKTVSHKPKEKTSVQFPQMKRCAIIPVSNVQCKVYSWERFTKAVRGNTILSPSAGSVA